MDKWPPLKRLERSILKKKTEFIKHTFFDNKEKVIKRKAGTLMQKTLEIEYDKDNGIINWQVKYRHRHTKYSWTFESTFKAYVWWKKFVIARIKKE